LERQGHSLDLNQKQAGMSQAFAASVVFSFLPVAR
jgi:hypothetical protein